MGSSTRMVSPRVAAEMLHLLGDNANWAVRPDPEGMATWALVRAVLRTADSDAVEALSARFPEHVEAFQAGPRSWGLDWLRSCAAAPEPMSEVENQLLGARLDVLAGVRR